MGEKLNQPEEPEEPEIDEFTLEDWEAYEEWLTSRINIRRTVDISLENWITRRHGMKVRKIDDHKVEGFSDSFNTHGLGEIIVGYPEGDMSSEYISEYEVQLSDGTWMPMREALKENKVISDNYDRHFREPINDVERERGFYF